MIFQPIVAFQKTPHAEAKSQESGLAEQDQDDQSKQTGGKRSH